MPAGTVGSLEQTLAARSASAPVVLPWRRSIAVLLLVMLLIPIKRYTLPVHVGFELEPYRVLVIALALGWIASLLIDSRARIRSTFLDAPLLLIFAAVMLSVALNAGRIQAEGIQSDVLKTVTFFLSFVLVYYLIVSVIRTPRDIDVVVKSLVVGGAIVAALALYEWRTGSNIFNHLRTIFPFLQVNVLPDPAGDITGFTRGGRLRAYGSAQHPIALGIALVMLAPLAIYLARRTDTPTRRWFWWLSAFLLFLGAFATASRTFLVATMVIAIVYLLLRPAQTLRLWPLAILLLLTVHVALPNTLGILRSSLFPRGGLNTLVVEQGGGTPDAKQGRLAHVGPTLSRISREPLLGVGYGSQIVGSPKANAPILDDEWLRTLLETGLVGAFAWVWLFGRFLRKVGRAAKENDSDRGWLLVGITASVAGFAASMLLFDAFAFIQVTFLTFVLLSLGAILVRPQPLAYTERRGSMRVSQPEPEEPISEA